MKAQTPTTLLLYVEGEFHSARVMREGTRVFGRQFGENGVLPYSARFDSLKEAAREVDAFNALLRAELPAGQASESQALLIEEGHERQPLTLEHAMETAQHRIVSGPEFSSTLKGTGSSPMLRAFMELDSCWVLRWHVGGMVSTATVTDKTHQLCFLRLMGSLGRTPGWRTNSVTVPTIGHSSG